MQFRFLLLLSLLNISYAFYNLPIKKRAPTKLNSHFSVIGTKIKDKDILIKSLYDLNNDFEIYDEPTLVLGYNEEVLVDLAIKQKNNKYLGFKLKNDVYTLVTDLQFWEQTVPVEVFMERLNKKYAIRTIYETCLEEGYITDFVKDNLETGVTEIQLSRYEL